MLPAHAKGSCYHLLRSVIRFNVRSPTQAVFLCYLQPNKVIRILLFFGHSIYNVQHKVQDALNLKHGALGHLRARFAGTDRDDVGVDKLRPG